jgi:hypothetical protein
LLNQNLLDYQRNSSAMNEKFSNDYKKFKICQREEILFFKFSIYLELTMNWKNYTNNFFSSKAQDRLTFKPRLSKTSVIGMPDKHSNLMRYQPSSIVCISLRLIIKRESLTTMISDCRSFPAYCMVF